MTYYLTVRLTAYDCPYLQFSLQELKQFGTILYTLVKQMLHSIMDFTLFPIGQGFLYNSNNHFTEKLRFWSLP